MSAGKQNKSYSSLTVPWLINMPNKKTTQQKISKRVKHSYHQDGRS